jgi:uncharacterized protein YodC (DUF2158 family)
MLRLPGFRVREEFDLLLLRCNRTRIAALAVGSTMTVIKSGDLVVLKSGGPIMTVDTVNTDIHDDDKITGVLCVWFFGEKLERVRFDHRAIEPAPLQHAAPENEDVCLEEAADEYKAVLDEMSAAMNASPEAEKDGAKVTKKSKRASAARHETRAASPPAES